MTTFARNSSAMLNSSSASSRIAGTPTPTPTSTRTSMSMSMSMKDTPSKSRSNSIDDNRLLISSYLHKKSLKSNQWKQYWVVLRKQQLNYYPDCNEHKSKRVYNIKNIKFISTIVTSKGENTLQFLIYTNDKILHFRTKDILEFNNWIHNLKLLFDHDESYKFPIEYISEDTNSHHRHHLSNGESPDDSSSEDLGPNQSSPQHHHLNATDKLQQLATPNHKDEYLVETGDLKLSNQFHYHHRLNLIKWKKIRIILTNKFAYVYKLNTNLNLIFRLSINDILEVLEIEPKKPTHQDYEDYKFLIITSNNHYLFKVKSENDLLNWLSCFKTLVNTRQAP